MLFTKMEIEGERLQTELKVVSTFATIHLGDQHYANEK